MIPLFMEIFCCALFLGLGVVAVSLVYESFVKREIK